MSNQKFQLDAAEHHSANSEPEPGDNFTKNELKLRLIKMGVGFDMALDRGQLVRLYDNYISKKEFRVKIESKLQADKAPYAPAEFAKNIPNNGSIMSVTKSTTKINGPLNASKPVSILKVKSVQELEKNESHDTGIKDLRESVKPVVKAVDSIKNLTDEREKHKQRKSESEIMKTVTDDDLTMIKKAFEHEEIQKSQAIGYSRHNIIKNNSSNAQTGNNMSLVTPSSNLYVSNTTPNTFQQQPAFAAKSNETKTQSLVQLGAHQQVLKNNNEKIEKKPESFLKFNDKLNYNTSKLLNKQFEESPAEVITNQETTTKMQVLSNSFEIEQKNKRFNSNREAHRHSSAEFDFDKTSKRKVSETRINVDKEFTKESSYTLYDFWPLLLLLLVLFLINLKLKQDNGGSGNFPLFGYFKVAFDFNWTIFSNLFEALCNGFIGPLINGITSTVTAHPGVAVVLGLILMSALAYYKFVVSKQNIVSEIYRLIHDRLQEMANQGGSDHAGISEDQIVEEFSTVYGYSAPRFRQEILPGLIIRLSADLNIIELIQSRSRYGTIIIWKWLGYN